MAAFGLLIVLGLRLTGMLDPDLAHADLLVLFLVWLVTKWVTRLWISP
jgi:hypothetical protein